MSSLITNVDIHIVSIPLKKPYHVSWGIIFNTEVVVVQITTVDNIVGVGEADCLLPFTSESVGTVFSVLESVIAPSLIGMNALFIRQIYAHMNTLIAGNLLAKGAIDMALYDILGKFYNAPVHALLGGSIVRREIPLLWPLSDQTPDDDIQNISERMSNGFYTFMLKMGGSSDIQMQIERVKTINRHFKAQREQLHICVDANQGWNLNQAIEFVQGLRNERLMFIEQPLKKTNIRGFRTLKRQSSHMLSADESIQSMKDAYEILTTNEPIFDVISLKCSKNGGITPMFDIGILANMSGGVQILCNSMLELGITQAACLHVASCLPNLVNGGHCFMSTLRMADDITNFAQEYIHDGIVHVPMKPGLGIDINVEKLQTYTIKSTRI